MKTKTVSSNRTAYFVIAILVIVIAFLLGTGPWLKDLLHVHGSMGMANIHWTQIFIGVGIGFILGLIVSKRKG
jgi:hypothetical protein